MITSEQSMAQYLEKNINCRTIPQFIHWVRKMDLVEELNTNFHLLTKGNRVALEDYLDKKVVTQSYIDIERSSEQDIANELLGI